MTANELELARRSLRTFGKHVCQNSENLVGWSPSRKKLRGRSIAWRISDIQSSSLMNFVSRDAKYAPSKSSNATEVSCHTEAASQNCFRSLRRPLAFLNLCCDAALVQVAGW